MIKTLFLMLLIGILSWSQDLDRKTYKINEIEKDAKTLASTKNPVEKELLLQDLQKKYEGQIVEGSFICHDITITKKRITILWSAGDYTSRKFVLHLSEYVSVEEGRKINKGSIKQLKKIIGKISFANYGCSIKIKQDE